MTLTLADFLLARIEEDEAKVAYMQAETVRAETAPIYGGLPPMLERFAAVDIFLSPKRWQAECAAKRRIVELHPHVFRSGDGDLVADEWTCQHCTNQWYWCPTLRLLALPYADHPNYREEWRP